MIILRDNVSLEIHYFVKITVAGNMVVSWRNFIIFLLTK